MNSQRSRGFGFITFTDSTTVPRVLAVPIHMLDGKRIDPKRYAKHNYLYNVLQCVHNCQ